MNILLAHPNINSVGGSEQSLRLSAIGLAKMGHRVSLLTGVLPTATEKWISGLFCRPAIFAVADGQFGKTAYETRLLIQELQAHELSVIHLHGWPASRSIRMLRKEFPLIGTAHVALCPNNARYHYGENRACEREIGLSCFTTGYRTLGCGHTGDSKSISACAFIRSQLTDRRLRAEVDQLDGLVAPSHWMANRLSTDGVSTENMFVIPPPCGSAVDPTLSASTSDPRRASAVEPAPQLLVVARLVEFKGVQHVLRALARMGGGIRLRVVGDGPYRAILEETASLLGITERCEFVGNQPPAEVERLRSQAEVCIVPSLWPENFSMSGQEAALAGRPVVAFRVGGNSEWCRDGENGILIEAGNVEALAQAVLRLMSSERDRERMGAAGAALASEWHVESHNSKVLQVYEWAIARRVERRVGQP